MNNTLTKEDYTNFLASVIECEEKQDSSVTHEWLLNSHRESVQVANYLRSHGYTVKTKRQKFMSRGMLFYVGVPFETIKSRVSNY